MIDTNILYDTCIIEQDALQQLLCPSDGTVSYGYRVLRFVLHVKEPKTLIVEEYIEGYLVLGSYPPKTSAEELDKVRRASSVFVVVQA